MNTRIHMHLRVLHASTDFSTWKTVVNEHRYIATKEVELLEIPKEGMRIEDGRFSLQLHHVSPSMSGPRYICEADGGYAHGWNDFGGIPTYWVLVEDALWFTECERQGWALERESGPHRRNERYPDYTKERGNPLSAAIAITANQ